MQRLSGLVMAAHVPPGGAGGGMVRYVVEIVRALDRRDDIDVHVVSSEAAAPWWAQTLGPARVHAVRALPAAAAGIRDLVSAGPPGTHHFDVVHGTKHLLPLRRQGTVSILTVYDMLPLDRPLDFTATKRALLRRPYLDSIRRADVLLCISEATQDRMLSYVPEVAARSEVVRLGTASALLDVAAEPVSELEPGSFVLAVGDNSPRKNLATLLAGWDQMSRRGAAARLVLTGPPGWGVEGADLAGAAGVTHLGHVSNGQLRWCYENAAAVAIPSMLEGYGLPAAEAVAFGTPLITSEDKALAEAAENTAMIADSACPDCWAAAMSAALSCPNGRRVPASKPSRGWDTVAEETVRAVRAQLLAPDSGGTHG